MNQEQAAEKKLAAYFDDMLADYSGQIREKFATIREQATEMLSLLENEADSISPPVSMDEILRIAGTHLEDVRLPFRQKIRWTQQFQTALHRVYTSLTQRDVLETVMDAAGLVSDRCLLLVVKKGAVVGWDARGYSDMFVENDLKPFAADVDGDFLSRRIMQEKKIFTLDLADVPVTEPLLEIPGWPKPEQLIAVPLCLFNVVSAILVLDADRLVPDPDEAIPAVDTLMFISSLWLENLTMRKSLGIEGIPRPPASPVQKEALAGAPAQAVMEAASPVPAAADVPPHAPAAVEELPAAEPVAEEEAPEPGPAVAEEEFTEAPPPPVAEDIPAESPAVWEEARKEAGETPAPETVMEDFSEISAPLTEEGEGASAAVEEVSADQDMEKLFAQVSAPAEEAVWEDKAEPPAAVEEFEEVEELEEVGEVGEAEELPEVPTAPVIEVGAESPAEAESVSLLDQVMADTAPYPQVEQKPAPEAKLPPVEEIPRFEADLARLTFQADEEYDAGATVMDGIPSLSSEIEIPEEIIPGEEAEEFVPEIEEEFVPKVEEEEIVLEEKPLEELILEEAPAVEEYKPPIKFTPPVEAPKPAARPPAPAWTSPEEEKLHNDARRFARLLVSEIKLYNEDAVTEGRIEKDLFNRLRRDIERSREMYGKRIPADVTRKVDYFHEEVVRILGEGDVAKLGSDYPGPQTE